MKHQLLPVALGAFALFSMGDARAQGLLSIGSDDDFYSGLPFTTSVGVDFGWDSNPSSSADGEDGSSYVRGGVDVAYGTGSRITPVRTAASFSTFYYFDDVAGQEEDLFYNARWSLNVRHEVNRRLTLGNNFYISYEIEPDYAIGASAQRRLDQYLYAYNSAWASYRLSRQLTSVTRYTLSGIRYDESEIGDLEDRLTHTLSQEFRYDLNRRTTVVGEYRFSHTSYNESNGRNYDSHYFLAGFDHAISRYLTSHLRVGGEVRHTDGNGNEDRPYGEFAIRSRIADKTSLHWINRFGLEDSELATFRSRYTYRSTLQLTHELTPRLRANTGITYLHNEFEGGGAPAFDEDLISGSFGLAYRVWSNVDVNANYTFTSVSSEAYRDYDRHRVSLGLQTTF